MFDKFEAIFITGIILFSIGYFPLKNQMVADELLESIKNLKTMPWLLPVDDIKGHLGEKIGFYFTFLGHYTTFLLPLAAVGGVTFIEVVYSNSLGTGGFLTPIFALLVCIWAQTLIEFWKRKQAVKVMEWGMTNYAEGEHELVGFEGEEILSGENDKYSISILEFLFVRLSRH